MGGGLEGECWELVFMCVRAPAGSEDVGHEVTPMYLLRLPHCVPCGLLVFRPLEALFPSLCVPFSLPSCLLTADTHSSLDHSWGAAGEVL